MSTTFSRTGGAVGTKGTAPEHRGSDACTSLVQLNRAALRLQPRFCPVLDCIPRCPAETPDLLLSYLTNMSTSQLGGWPGSLEGTFLAGCRVWRGLSTDQHQGQLLPAWSPPFFNHGTSGTSPSCETGVPLGNEVNSIFFGIGLQGTFNHIMNRHIECWDKVVLKKENSPWLSLLEDLQILRRLPCQKKRAFVGGFRATKLGNLFRETKSGLFKSCLADSCLLTLSESSRGSKLNMQIWDPSLSCIPGHRAESVLTIL